MYTCSEARMADKIKTFSTYGDAGHGGITRYSMSPEAIQARNEFRRRMEAIGAEIEIDDVGDMYATLPGSEPGLKRIAMGSHCDSVKNGASTCVAMIWASVVLPTPGGPHRMNEEICSDSIIRRKMQSLPTRCFCPIYSSRFFGRSLSASGSNVISLMKSNLSTKVAIIKQTWRVFVKSKKEKIDFLGWNRPG